MTNAQGYAPVNGLQMYYEVHGDGPRPLVLVHGSLSATGTSFGTLLPALAKTRQVIAVEMQGHARFTRSTSGSRHGRRTGRHWWRR